MAITKEMPLERYVLEAELSQNDQFTIHRARRKSDDTIVIIKVVAPLLASDEFFVRRFKQISGQVAQLEHPNILYSCEAEAEDDLLYVVQDFVEARSLRQVIETEGPFSPQRMQFIAEQIASTLDYAHQKSVMHGDLSAQRIYLGSNDRVLVADFGQSQVLFGTDIVKHGCAGSSPQTLAPERARGQGPSRYSDLYSLGILCYQMLAKEPPFTGPPSTVLHAQAYRQPRPLHRVNPGIPIAVSEAIGRMLSKGVELRYSTGAEFTRALSVACQSQKRFHQYEDLTTLAKRERRHSLMGKSLVYLSIALVFVLLSLSLAIWAGYELGLKHAIRRLPPTPIVVTPPISPLQDAVSSQAPGNKDLQNTALSALPELRSSTTLLATPIPGDMIITLSDILLPTPTPLFDRLLATTTATSTPTPTPLLSPAFISRATLPASAPAIPVDQGLLVFYNPTGHDLIVDLTGPTGASALVPPDSEEEFSLELGHYQLMVHTPTGNWLPSRTITFDLFEGQVVEKDYYSDFDPLELQQ